jgi:hypothetical protein
VPYPSPDDLSTWTLASDCLPWLIVNMPGHERRYDAWILRGEARKRWGHLMASYTYSDSRGNTIAGPDNYAYEFADYFPVGFYNYYGKLPDHAWHRIKLNGYFLLPGRFTVGVEGWWTSPLYQLVYSTCGAFREAPGKRSTEDQMAALGIDPATMAYCSTPDGITLDSRYIFHRPMNLATNSVWQLDLQLSKTFKVGPTDIDAILTVYNVFGHEWDSTFNGAAFRQDTDDEGNGLIYQDDDPGAPYYDEYYGADGSPVLVPIGAPLSYRDPRRYEIGVRIEF